MEPGQQLYWSGFVIQLPLEENAVEHGEDGLLLVLGRRLSAPGVSGA